MAKSAQAARKDAKGGAARKGPAKPEKKPAAKPAKGGAKPKPGAKPASKATSKPTPKPPAKAPAKPAAKPTKPEPKPSKPDTKASSSKAPAKPAKGAPPAPKAPGKPAPAAAATAGGDKNARKGITIVSSKPAKKSAAKPSQIKIPEFGTPLSELYRKPLITSGPKAPKPKSLAEGVDDKPRKTPFNAKELAYYKQLLLKKRSELIGDVSTMETEALMSQSGSLSNLPQHMAEQGSDAYGQSLSLDLAAADRKLIKEIDDALQRIGNGTYGVCELTGKPIRKERLEELPWARYSIEAARELERRTSLQ